MNLQLISAVITTFDVESRVKPGVNKLFGRPRKVYYRKVFTIPRFWLKPYYWHHFNIKVVLNQNQDKLEFILKNKPTHHSRVHLLSMDS